LPLLGYLVVAKACRNVGYELVYNSLHRDPEQIVIPTIQEAVGLIGISYLFGVHVQLFSRALKLIREIGADNITVLGGGLIPGGRCSLAR
jgi:methylmalonyl-CoA mutase cobalamin-binding domain/chain